MAFPVSAYIQHDETTEGVFGDFVLRKSLDIAVDFVANVYRLAIPANTEVVSVRLRVKVASNGTTPTVAVADNAGTPLVYIHAAGFDPSQAAGYQKNSLTLAQTGKDGYFYASPALLTVTLAGGVAPTTGKLVLEVVMSGAFDKPKDMINNFPTY